MTGQAPPLNIHLSTHTLWITEKLLMDSVSFVQFSFAGATSAVYTVMSMSSVLFLHGHTSTDAVKHIVLLLRPVGNRNRSVRRCVKSVRELLFLTARTPASCLITLSVWCDVQTCIKSYRELVQLIWCTVLCWFKELSLYYLSFIHRLALSSAFIYHAHRSSLWCQPGHYLWQCLVRLPLP